ncbi:unnamed protein product [Urochloa decumbens]|uniref:F-box domain-containing protein n=1 Tax=Urochloa decumbens TaxID=240449 RepID=A0ABC8X3P8_9POAL
MAARHSSYDDGVIVTNRIRIQKQSKRRAWITETYDNTMGLPTALLPDDMLADVLRRLPPRSLAAARSVCTAWRAAIDDRRLLRADLLPRSLAGILINFPCTSITDFFSWPSTDPSISGKHVDYLPESSGKRSWSTVIDHCNGLLLLYHYVLNPATRRCDPVPPEPILMETKDRYEKGYLAISLSNDTYRVIESPPGAKGDRYHLELLLGKSEKGVYCTLRRGDYSFQVWLLEESSCRTQWVPRHEMDLLALFLKPNPESTRRVGSPKQHPHGPWILQDIDYYYEYNEDDDEDDMGTPLQDEELEWSSEASDDDGMFDCSSNNDDDVNPRDIYGGDVSILGFHPFREIVFINYNFRRGLAYHLNTSKVEDLGNIYSESLDCVPPNGMHIHSSFPYTPCLV